MLHYITYESESQAFTLILIYISFNEKSYGVLNYEILWLATCIEDIA